MTKRPVLIGLSIAAVLLLLAGAAGLGLLVSGVSRVVVTNAAGRPIDRLSVEVCRQRLDFDGLADGESRTRWYRIRGDSDFVVRGEIADGTPIAHEGGYVTGGMFLERADVTVRPGGEVELDEHL